MLPVRDKGGGEVEEVDCPSTPAARRTDAGAEDVADALHHAPSRRLAHVQVLVQLHAARSLQVRCHHVDCGHPLLTPQLAGLHYRALAHREILAAVLAPIRHRLATGHDACGADSQHDSPRKTRFTLVTAGALGVGVGVVAGLR